MAPASTVKLLIHVNQQQHPVTVKLDDTVLRLKHNCLGLLGNVYHAEQTMLLHNYSEVPNDVTLRELSLTDNNSLIFAPRQQPNGYYNQQNDRYYKLEKSGEGTFGVVYKARDTLTNTIVALKKIRSDHDDEGIPSSAVREISVLQELDHANLVKLLDVHSLPPRLYLVFEFLDCDLKQYLDSRNARQQLLLPSTVNSYLHQLLSGIDYCHAKRIVHRDLKPQNILVSSDRKTLKIADFGLARDFQYPLHTYTRDVVTLWYRAPELLLGQKRYSPQVDVWSTACVFGEMSTGAPLFPGECEVDSLYKIFQTFGTPNPSIWQGVSDLPQFNPVFPKWRPKDISCKVPDLEPLGLDLIAKMLVLDPTKRLTPSQVFVHSFFTNPLYLTLALCLTEQKSRFQPKPR
ncbi:hypothetical protein DIPPA_58019, partial [Diplonema papillatum]